MKKKGILIPLVLFLALSLVAIGCPSTPTTTPPTTTPPTTAPPTTTPTTEQPEEEILKIGYIAGLTGIGSGTLKNFVEGAQIGVEWIRDQGGVKVGNKVYNFELVVEDCEGTSEGAADAATRIIYDKGLNIIIQDVSMPFVTIGAGSVTEPAEALRFCLFNCLVPEEYGPQTPYTFVYRNATMEGLAASMEFLSTNYPEVKTIVDVYVDDGSVPIIAPIVKAEAAKYGVTILNETPITYPSDIVDLVPIATKSASYEADAVAFSNGFPIWQGAILKALRERGYSNLVFGMNYCDLDEMLAIAGPEASTDYWVCSVHAETPLPPMCEEIKARMLEKYGHCKDYHFVSVQGVWILAQAIEAAQSIDPTAIRDTLENLDTVETPFGTGYVCGLETYGIKHSITHPQGITGLMGGKIELLGYQDVYTP